AGDCAAGGSYSDLHGSDQGFVVAERNGVWDPAIEVPGLGKLNKEDSASVISVSCGSARNCVAGGGYLHYSDDGQGCVTVEQNGTWGPAIRLHLAGDGYYPQGDGSLGSVSCPSADNCLVGGSDSGDQPSFEDTSAFLAAGKNGHWGKVFEVPGLGDVNYGTPDLDTVSCGSAGNCAAGGSYSNRADHSRAFVVDERHGRWHGLIAGSGLAGLKRTVFSEVYAVSCARAGNCAAVGSYQDHSHHLEGFVVTLAR